MGHAAEEIFSVVWVRWNSLVATRRIRRMNPKELGIAIAFLIAISGFGQGSSVKKTVPLYPMDKSCVCIKTKKETKTIVATVARVGKSSHQVVYQVFWSRTLPRRELFRVEIGSYSKGEGAELWNYGIAKEGDFNGDGLPDYAWYGGDDGGEYRYLFLSSDDGYKRVDVLKTVEAAWRERFDKLSPDFSNFDSGIGLSETVLEGSQAGMVLHAAIHRRASRGKGETTYRFDISQADFKP